MPHIIQTFSAEETLSLGRQIGRLLAPGMILGLCGDLGAGKTCLVKGIAEGLGIAPETVTSPTFTLVAEHYRGRVPLYHIDLYRLEGVEGEELGYEEYLFGQGVAVVEWFPFLPNDMREVVEEYLLIAIECGAGDTRMLALTPYGKRYDRLLAQVGTIRTESHKR
ncbi:MAG: tRNA (adenosine(37)-N6)-threonylcarbamoyltransferase complex ATPase subunit type 1 TsaE [Desulfurellaceae bacterium]|nr:tRNA (adenosine(37)-N6)-threonylcarbamoyltransferase complex ATPase subunit type 1 TsaE [Desulfurellaceae bacterium]